MFVYTTIYPPIFLLLYIAFRKRPPKKELTEEQKITQRTAAYVVLAGLAAFTSYYVITGQNPRLSSWQLLAIVAAFVIIAILHYLKYGKIGVDIKADAGFKLDAVSIVYFMIILVTVLFLLITSPYTVAGARKALAERGFHETVFRKHYPSETQPAPEDPDEEGQPAAEDPIPVEAGHLGAYYFMDVTTGRKLYVDVASGEITLDEQGNQPEQ